MVHICIKSTTKLSHHFHWCVPIIGWDRLLGLETTCMENRLVLWGDVITRLCDVNLIVLNVYSFGTNVKYSAKNSHSLISKKLLYNWTFNKVLTIVISVGLFDLLPRTLFAGNFKVILQVNYKQWSIFKRKYTENIHVQLLK